MIYEIAELYIKPDAHAAFQAGVAEAVPLFKAAKGCLSMRLDRDIETLEQAIAARDAGCHELQGFFYARPLTVADAGDWMRRQFSARDTDAEPVAG